LHKKAPVGCLKPTGAGPSGGDGGLGGSPGNEVTSWKQDQERDQDQRGQKTSERTPQPGRRNLLCESCPTIRHFCHHRC